MKKISRTALGFCLALLVGLAPNRAVAQAQQPGTLVIEGGTLIDGNGGPPVRDSLLIIQGNRITAVSRKGQASVPANAQVIQADGKFIVPGLWDSQVIYSWYYGELMLNHGVTSSITTGTGYELIVPLRDAIHHGKAYGPRLFTPITNVDSVSNRTTGLETPFAPGRVPRSAEHMREMMKLFLDSGADYVILHDGRIPREYQMAAFEEARKAGKPVFTRATGPGMTAKDAAAWGSKALPHSYGVSHGITRGQWNNELDRYADMDEAKVRPLIDMLVKANVALVPTIFHSTPSYPRDWARFEEETRQLFRDPDLLTYFYPKQLAELLANFRMRDQGEVRERRMRGYQNMLRFHKMFADAGGRVLAGGDTNSSKAPGLLLHHEMQILEEAGIAPMQIIQGVTKWPAEAMQVHDRLGTIEPGKLADLVIVSADPLQTVRNLRTIDTVIKDGKVVDRTYHAWFNAPFPLISAESPVVEGLEWVVAVKAATFRPGQGGGPGGGAAGGAVPNPPESPQPAIATISPYLVTQGSPALNLTLKGFNFVRRTRVFFDGYSIPYRRVSPTELEVTLDENLLRRAGRFEIVVENPGPLATPEWGNGTSNKAHLIVNFRY